MSAAKPMPSRAELRAMFTYDRKTGVLAFKPRPLKAPNDRVTMAFNTRWAGKPAGAICTVHGYMKLKIPGVGWFKVHRIIWKMETDQEPPDVDHKNRIRHDNRFKNLRAATRQLNTLNRDPAGHKNNKVGAIGVYMHGNRFRASFRGSYLGSFPTLEEAKAARQKALTSFEKGVTCHAND